MCSSLPAIEALLHEFYQPATPNARKRQIETELIAFKSQPEAWQLCLRVACASFEPANQFVWFFATSTLEHTITRRWTQLPASEHQILREHLWNTYAHLAIDGSVPRRQRDTFAQLIAQMGKREFPDEHPNYVLHCCELIKTRFPLGITLLRTTSEEVVSQREDCSTDRKNYFHSCISMCIPDVMDLMTKYLLIAVCHINGKDIHSIPSNLMDYTLVTSLPNDNQLSSSLLELLTCVQHLVSWIRTDLISEYFLMSILDLSQWRATVAASGADTAAHQDISLAALSVLNELLYLQRSLPYARTLMSGVNMMLDQHNASTKLQSEIYVDKFRELLRLYSMKYASKLIQDNELLEGFLKPLYGCTIHKNGALDFTEKLDIWTPIIKGLVANAKLNRYNDIVHQLLAEIMRRTQFEYNKAELELLDNEIMEDNTQTEWQQFLTQCIECVALVAETRPNAVFAQVFAHWSRPHVYLLSVESDIDSGKGYELARKLKCTSFTEHLRDFATVCQAVVRIAPLLNANTAEVAAEVNCQLLLLMENLLTTLKFFTSNKLTNLVIDKSAFQCDLDYLYAQVLMALRSILPICQSNLKSKEMLYTLFDALGSIFLPGAQTVAPIVYLAASQLLVCISSVIRPKFLLEIPTILNLMQAGPRLNHLPRQAIANVYISLISYLVLPWKSGFDDQPSLTTQQQQDFPRRCAVLRDYVECLAQTFLELDLNTESSKVSAITLNLLSTFSLVIEFFKDSSNTTKDMLASAFKPVITKALMIYNNFGASSNSIAITVAEFSLSILRALQNQLGSQFIKEMFTLFISVRSREQLTASRLAVLERILQMFQLIVEQPGNASISMLPSILDFAIEEILPLVQQHHDDSNSSSSGNITDSSDLSSVLYTLFDSILTCKWQYFYKSHVQHNGSLLQSPSGTSAAAASSDNLHPEHFMTIMNAYGQILVTGTDPSIVRTVLLSLQNVNDRWRLYQRTLFKDTLLASFQSALIKVLLSGEGALHYELLANALFAMGQVDTLKMRESFATAGFPVNLKIIDEICLSSDIPTFSQKLSQLIQDTHCVHLAQT